jgi:16S rRNA (uracil1498-N3)-methyltransferase
MDTAIQKAVELGVAAVVPLTTAYTTVRLDRERAHQRHRHWQEVVVSACEQCGRGRLPPVAPPEPLEDWLRRPREGLRLCLDPEAGERVRDLAWDGAPVTLLVGPEGGLAPAERTAAGAAGYRGLSLGPRVLRTETAPLAALAVLQARWGDLGG